MTPKVVAVLGLLALFSSRLTTCRSPGEGGGDASNPHPEKAVELKGVDTSSLTARERSEWSSAVSELLGPCSEHPVSVAQCVRESRPCAACLPAARYLLEQVQRGRTRTQIEAAYRARFAADQVTKLEIEGSPRKGPKDAPVVIVEFADFECPACGAARPAIDEVYDKHPNEVAVVFKHFPLSMHPHAEKAARAAVAAAKQGKFWEMHALLFDNQTQLTPENVEKLAEKAGLDLTRFRQDRDSEATADVVARDRKQGEALKLDSTPSLFVNGRKFPGSPDFKQDLEDWIALELTLVPRSAPSAAPAAFDSMRGGAEGLGCFPTGRHYPGIAHLLRVVAAGLAEEFASETALDDLTVVAIDTETTGLDAEVDRVVEIACVRVVPGAETVRRSWLVNPGRPIPKASSDVTGIDDEKVKDAPPFAAIAAEVLEALVGAVPLAYNAEYDRKVLTAELSRAGISLQATVPATRRAVEWIDPLIWARELQRAEKSRALSEVAERLGIKLEQAHRATDDADAALAVFAAFRRDTRVPRSYGALMQEQRRLSRLFDEERQRWRGRP